MKMSDLITDGATNQMSHTKIWSNVANAVTTCIVAWEGYKGTIVVDVFIAYLVFVGASALGSKFLSYKYGTPQIPTDTTIPTN